MGHCATERLTAGLNNSKTDGLLMEMKVGHTPVGCSGFNFSNHKQVQI